MHWLLGLCLVLAVVPLTGCLEEEPTDCQPFRGHGIVEAVYGNDVRIRLDDGQPAVLHLSQAVFVQSGDDCMRIGPEGVLVGDQITFEVDAWAESYPVQGWPEAAVIIR